ncbi:MAG: thiamine diphosphokinase [Lachnospiraceae bacterium]|nr:thiamine diphosphokinase [Lachnospiraceae bacterium]
MKTKCLIISGGNYEKVNMSVEDCFVIACDKGLAYAELDGIVPDLVIGDFDSYGCCPNFDGEMITLPAQKDDTDTMFAVKEAVKRGFEEIIITSALGGRMDHLYANYQAMMYAITRNVKARIVSQDMMIIGLHSGMSLVEKVDPGQIVSVFSYSDFCSGVTIKGTFYDVTKVDLTNDFPLGQSNYANSTEIEVSVEIGKLIVMILREIHE